MKLKYGICSYLNASCYMHRTIYLPYSQVCDAEEILQILISINIKDKNCDLFKMYIYLSLVENWLLFDDSSNDKAVVHELWSVCLRNCSCGITITDLRPYALNVSVHLFLFAWQVYTSDSYVAFTCCSTKLFLHWSCFTLPVYIITPFCNINGRKD